jgi:hypothetical protein
VNYEDWRAALSEANDPAFWPITAIDEELAAGRAQFWCDGEAALVSRVIDYPGGAQVLDVLAAAGKLKNLTQNIAPMVEQWSRQNGLSHMMVAGRGGWVRVLRDWRHYQSIMVKELA